MSTEETSFPTSGEPTLVGSATPETSEPAEIATDTPNTPKVPSSTTILQKCKGFFTEETYRVLASLIVPLLLIVVIFSMIGKKMCQQASVSYGSHSATGSLMRQVCGAPGKGSMIVDMQSASMSTAPHALNDIDYVNKLNTAMAGALNDGMQDARGMFNQTRTLFAGALGDAYAVMMNIVIQMVRMGLKTKDIAGKMGGATAAIANATQGAMLSGESFLNGPIMAVLKVLCFTGTTPVELADGRTVKMRGVKIGDVLKGGSIVTGVMQFANVTQSRMYSLPGCDARVSGSHLVKGPNGRFIPVSEHPEAVLTDERPELVYSLTTSDNLIRLGNVIFWDYND